MRSVQSLYIHYKLYSHYSHYSQEMQEMTAATMTVLIVIARTLGTVPWMYSGLLSSIQCAIGAPIMPPRIPETRMTGMVAPKSRTQAGDGSLSPFRWVFTLTGTLF